MERRRDIEAELSRLTFNDRHRLIIGLDYGTTYSGVCYVMSDKSNVEDITVLKIWPGNPSALKVPTTIAYREENPGKFQSEHRWGFEATKQVKGQRPQTCSWTKLLLDAKADYNENDDPKLKEINGKSMYHLPAHRIDAGVSRSAVAVEVCEDFLREVYSYLEKHLKSKLRESVFNSTPIECWVTVPATWSDRARDITKKAAEKAGFRRQGKPHDVVNVISEPEAAALSILRTNLSGENKFTAGDNILICDCGGGTVDITTYGIHEVKPQLVFNELCVGEGAKCGSTYIDRNFHELMTDRFGEAYTSISETHRGPGSKFMADFESVKKDFGAGGNDYEDRIGLKMDAPDSECYDSAQRDVILSRDDMRGLFDPVVDSVIRLVDQQVKTAKNEEDADIDFIFLVGGFGESMYLKQKMDKHFKKMEVICPSECQVAVVKGAALRGLEGVAPQKRRCKRHYGIECDHIFREGIDEEQHSYINPYTGDKMCKGRTFWLMAKGEEITKDTSKKFAFRHIFAAGDARTIDVDFVSTPLINAPERLDHPKVSPVGKIVADFSKAFDTGKYQSRWVWSEIQFRYMLHFEIKIDFGAESGILECSFLVDGAVVDKASIAYES